jgi:hypothetical protein
MHAGREWCMDQSYRKKVVQENSYQVNILRNCHILPRYHNVLKDANPIKSWSREQGLRIRYSDRVQTGEHIKRGSFFG